ncbi:MAG: pitrilysin family protein [Hyphomicrobiales bacterium]|nr:pitrilysin family protein [Hyphomicrobiales bacterium]
MRAIRTVLLSALFLAPALTSATAERFAPNAQEFSLANGMQVVVIPDHRAPVVTHMIWYKVGSADEPPGKTGVAHFLEHLMFKGTPTHPNGDFSRIVAEKGGQENAFTSTDYTGYFQKVARDHLGQVMELEADRMANLVLGEKETAAERDVVLEERRSRVDNDPGSQLAEEIAASLYRSHPYGRPVIGWEHEIKALNRADAIEFYNTYYTPNNAILVVAGDVTPEEVRALAEKTYGKLARRAEPGARVRPAEPPQRAERRLTLASPRVEQETLRRAYDVPSTSTAAPGEAEALDLFAELLGGGPTSRLYQSLIVRQKIATSAGAWYSSSALDDGQFGIHAVPRDDTKLADLETAIDAVIAELIEEGISDKDLERAKTGLLASAVYAQDSQSRLARTFGAALASGETIAEVQDWPDRIAKVGAAEVIAVARKYLVKERAVTGFLVREQGKPQEQTGNRS